MAHEVFDPTRKFVRLIEVKQNGMVEFEFAVGEPELFVELLLPASAFAEFCAANQVMTLDPARPLRGAAIGGEEDLSLTWSLQSARDKVSSNK